MAVVVVVWTDVEWRVIGNGVGNADNETRGQVHIGNERIGVATLDLLRAVLTVLGYAEVERQNHRVDLARWVDNNLRGYGPGEGGLCNVNGCRLLLARSEQLGLAIRIRVVPLNANPAVHVVGLVVISMPFVFV
jgi:hypothetical protein